MSTNVAGEKKENVVGPQKCLPKVGKIDIKKHCLPIFEILFPWILLAKRVSKVCNENCFSQIIFLAITFGCAFT